MKFGLRNIRTLLRSAGQPHRHFRSIHIAGTNGKGSTASYIASIFTEAGYRTALYTSPHLVRFTERIRIDGREITERRLVDYVRQFRPAIEAVNATFFEATTCVAFRYFADQDVDIAVIETGLGGRLDATNVLHPLVSVITNIALEHQEYLGNTIRSIAKEKGGIIKPGVPVVTASTDTEVLTVFRRIARNCGAPLFEAAKIVRLDAPGTGHEKDLLGFTAPHISVRNVQLGLKGEHQRANARLAVAVIEVLRRRRPFRASVRLGSRAVKTGLKNVRANTGLQGRLQRVGRGGRIVLDVAHNPAGVKVLADALALKPQRKYVAVMGAMKDKDVVGMLREIGRIARLVITVAPATQRAVNPRILVREARRLGIRAVVGGSVGAGLRRARRFKHVLITGSHYVVGEALEILTKEKA